MGRVLIVSKLDAIAQYKAIAEEYPVGFEPNDFFIPSVLDDADKTAQLISKYQQIGVPQGSTIHGAFFDIVVFSSDERIAAVSKERMRQSMEIGRKLGSRGVVFHTNVMPMLYGKDYDAQVVSGTVSSLKELLMAYPDVSIYLENMFDRTPDIIETISKELCSFPNYGVCLDYAHARIYGADYHDFVTRVQSYVKHIHINDNDLQHDLHLALGNGRIDWQEFDAYYKNYFSDCSVLIETNDPKDQIASLKYIEQKMKTLAKELRK